MTPCEEMGLKVGDEFEVIDDANGFKKGQIVTLENDDGSISPLFKGEGGICNGTAYLALGIQVKPINSEVEPEPQYCESVTRTIPDQPTIEQLAAEYRAKLAIAQQAQEEADSHRCGAEAALERLYQTGLAIGLDIAIADSEQEGENQSELVITDWRDLQVGDEIEYLGGTTDSWIGKKGVVQLIVDGESNLKILFRCGEEGKSGNPLDWPSTRWLSDFKFIRRP